MAHQGKEKLVHEVFEAISEKYDFMNSVISFRRHIAWRRDTMGYMDVKPGQSALDVCCGTGDWTIALAEAVGAGGLVCGLDFSAKMLKVADGKIKALRLDQVELLQGNAMALPFGADTFDWATIGFGLRNVPDYLQVLREMRRVVKPGGKVVCLETSQPTIPLFRQFYYAYFRYLMPVLGKIFARSYKEYAWLQESAGNFPGRRELAAIFYAAGLEDVQVRAYTGGVAAMHMGIKR
ncbi:MAG: demethylmenaquinone methyltransferase [Firmicutes bacterium]|nr:demethylmenaquinone methyltransferase [Bacillota bacterium]